MPFTGLKLPVGVNSSGGAALEDGDSQDGKIIMMALGSDDNENAFQQGIGLGDSMVFDTSDPSVRGRISGRIRQLFRSFQTQRRFRLFPASLSWEQNSETQDLTLSFRYLNLETDEVNTFSRTYGAEKLNG